ncbi:PQQ-dependent sugar dehydrogenase [Sediminibacterium ginsengisoli]|uniref:Glucose / Sorbosone dehydrogenase n=1 Tax=Sediminibacterium ginsengisoli TaxID=413434 RepID=A0A1T4R0D6_9BACT|nr:PQQ-dependent sugar dehydrogenase [Sediminibacterium ginsengisoli]SKA09450.1 Glucose / Sorbosone dehydrogenase [Sediminibacterium ginsengisoli]
MILRVSRILSYSILFCFVFSYGYSQVLLQPHRIVLPGGASFNLNIPKGYHVSVAANVSNRLRFLAKSPDNRLFATDMYNRGDNKRGRIYLFEDWDDSARQFRKKTVFAENLHNPNQILFYTDKGTHYLYIAETGKLTRYEYRAGEKTLKGEGQVLARFPDYGLDYKYGGWHLTRSITQHNGKIYVSVGSSCNACIEKEDIRASVIEMNPDGSGSRTYATGVRNSVGIKWFNNQLWATFMGRDLLGPDKPEDLFGTIENGKNYGWPFYLQYKQKIYPDKAMMDSAAKNNIKTPPPPPLAYCGFKAHTAPLGFDKFTGFSDPLLKDKFLVALHGSTTVSRQRGNAVVMITGKNKYVEVVTGFLSGKTEKDRHGRPCDVMMNDNHSFFVTDDKNGVLYYIWR